MDKDNENEIRLLIYTELEELLSNLQRDIKDDAEGRGIVVKLFDDIKSRRQFVKSAVQNSKEQETGGVHDITGFKSVFNSESSSSIAEREREEKEK